MNAPLRASAPLRETKTTHRVLALAILLLAAALRFYDLGARSLWYDEAYSWWVAAQVTVQESLASSVAEIIPPGSYFLWRGWIALTGESEFALRAASALLGVIAVAAAGRVTWRLTCGDGRGRGIGRGDGRGDRARTIALMLFAVAPPLLWAAREVRMYGPLLAFTLLADMALLEALFGPPTARRRWAWLWGLATLLSLYTYVLAGFWLIGQAVFVGIVIGRKSKVKGRKSKVESRKSKVESRKSKVESRKSRIDGAADQRISESTDHPVTLSPCPPRPPAPPLPLSLLPPALAAAALYLPWVLAAARSLGVNRGYWPGHLPFAAFLRTTFQGITVFSFIAPEERALAIAGGILLLATLALAFTRRRPLAGLYPLCYLLPAALLGYLYRSIPKWGLRHSVLFAPAPTLALALAWGCAQRRSARVALGVITALVALPLLWADANLLLNPAFAAEDWRGAAQYVQAHRRPDDLVIVETGSVFPTWVYYAGDEALLPLPDDVLLDVTHVLHYGNTAPLLNARLRAGQTVWLITWLEHVTDPTGMVPTLLGDLGAETPLPAFHGLGVRRFDLTRAPDFPPEPPVGVRAGVELLPGTGRGDPTPTRGIWLWGYTLPGMAPADAPLTLRTWWTTPDPAAHRDRFYQASLRLTDAAGHTWARNDAPPGAGDYRPERWPADTPVMGTFELSLPPGAPAGTYTATLILYDEGQTAAPFMLGTVRVARAATPPDIPPEMTPVAALPNEAPLTLLAARLDADKLTPCADLTGEAFWEVQQPLPGGLRVQIALGEAVHAQPLTADFDPADWQVGDRFRARFRLPLPCRAPDVTAPLALTLLPAADIPLATWAGPEVTAAFGRQFALPQNATPLSEVVQTEIAALAGYRLEPAVVIAGQPCTLTLYWRVTAETAAPYTAFVHVTPPDAPGPVAAQHDAWPAQGARATYTWRVGEVVADAHPLLAPPPGVYALRVGLYDPDAIRLPLTVAGHPAPDAVYVIPEALTVPAGER